jgi:hypothetical protein
MSENDSSGNALVLPENHVLEIPAFGKSPALKLDMTCIRRAESRIIESKRVNPSTYLDLEFAYNEGYREARRHMTAIGYQLALAQKALEEARADVLLGSYADFMVGKPKYTDNANLREAFITRDPAYSAAYDRVAQLKALESHMDTKIKLFENTCRYMKKQMDLVIRSGTTGPLYPSK